MLECKPRRDGRADLSGLPQVDDGLHIAGVGLRVAFAEVAQIHAHDEAALEQHQIQRQARDAGGETHHQMSAMRAQRSGSGFGIRPAHRVVDQVCAMWAHELFELVRQCFLRVTR